MGGEAEGDGAGVTPCTPDPAAAAAERARIDRVKRAALEGRLPPARPKSIIARDDLILFGVLIGVLCLCLVASSVLRTRGAGFWANLPMLGILIMSLAFAPLRARVVRRAVARVLSPHQGLVCLRCHYPLTRCPSVGQCPECGTLYTQAGVVEQWRIAYGFKNDGPAR